MKFRISGLALLLLMLVAAACAPANDVEMNEEAEMPQKAEQMGLPEGYTLIWQDEFDGNQLNPENWTYDLGGGGWGNHCLLYTSPSPRD